mgnify:CR=1 FL=1
MSGCQSSHYYTQAILGQVELFRNSKPIEKVLQQNAVDDETKFQLKKILKIRNFATRELGLKNNKSYLYYSDIKRKYVVWNVFVTPALSLDAEQWCFPFAGCVTYRGYFKRNEAKIFLEKKKTEGMDVFLSGVSAYSTLGWFSDPVLNTFVNYSDIDLVRLVFHELAHQIVYVKDDTTFNESFAVCIENEGVKRWLSANGSQVDRAVWEEHLLSKKNFFEILEQKKDELTFLYKSDMTESIKLREKAIMFNQLKAEYNTFRQTWPRENRYDWLFSQTLNNAVLVAIANYSEYVPFFTNLLDKKKDFPSFFDEVITLAEQPFNKRKIIMELSN